MSNEGQRQEQLEREYSRLRWAFAAAAFAVAFVGAGGFWAPDWKVWLCVIAVYFLGYLTGLWKTPIVSWPENEET